MDKRLLLLLSAKKLFAKQGVDKTSIREISRDSQVNSSMISYYFTNKDGLIKALFDEFFPKVIINQSMENPVDKIEKILLMIINLRHEDPDLIDILHSEIILKSHRLEDIQSYTDPFWKELYHLLDQCKHEGLLNFPSTDTAYMYVLATISFPYHNPMFSKLMDSKDLDFEGLISLIMKGLR